MFEIIAGVALIGMLVLYSRVGELQRRIQGLESNLQKAANYIEETLAVEPVKPKKSTKKAKPKLKEPEKPVTETTIEEPKIAAASSAPAEKIVEKAPSRSWSDIEKMIGERWSVIAGGITMALGTIFLVKYSIEAGLLGPMPRIALGFAISAALLAGGEWLRRHDKKLAIAAIPNADVPSVLTGAGIVGAFSAMYAGYALYGFFGPTMAFIGLTIIALSALVLSSLHGPKIAAIGTLGAYLVPMLVSSKEPNAIALAIHVLVVTACVMATARLRKWDWLAIAGIIGATVWTCLAAFINGTSAGIAGPMLVLGSCLIYGATFVPNEFNWKQAPTNETDSNRTVQLAGCALLLSFVFQLAVNSYLPILFTGAVLSIALMASAAFIPGFTTIAFISATVVILSALRLDLEYLDIAGLYRGGDFAKGIVPADISTYLLKASSLAALPALISLFGSYRHAIAAPRTSGYLGSAAGIIAFITLIIVYLRIAPFETRPLFGAIALALAVGFAFLVETFTKLDPNNMKAPAPAAFAVTSISLIAFAIGVSLSKSWIPLGFAITSVGIAYVFTQRPLKILPWLSCAAAILAGASLWFSVPFPSVEIGKTPFLNNLILLVGLPAAAILGSGEILRREGTKLADAIITTIGLAALALFISLELRHWISDGDIFGGQFTLADMATQSIAAMGFTIGLQLVAKRTGTSIFSHASYIAGGLNILVTGIGLILVFNPLIITKSVGETTFINLLLPSYLVTAIIAGIIAYMARPIRPRLYTLSYAALSGLLLFLFVTTTTRHAFQGGRISIFRYTTDLEFWTYSAVWLALGAVVLTLGFYLKSLPVRMAAAILITLTVIKVFLLDMSELTGVLRAISFLGLGAFLIIVGRYYQRILIGVSKQEKTKDNGK